VGQAPRELTPLVSALRFFGAQLRYWRTLRTLSQTELRRLTHDSGALIGKIEKREQSARPSDPATQLAAQHANVSTETRRPGADFYYTVSSPLTEQAWGHQDTLAKLVRVIRQTRPEIATTMDPAPQPGNHGNHQFTARLALEAYTAAADFTAFSEQISTEHLHPWAMSRLFLTGMQGEPVIGPDGEKSLHPTESTDQVYAVRSLAGFRIQLTTGDSMRCCTGRCSPCQPACRLAPA
jgi:transcriptional regulator with XRE-family HTH domain